MQKIMIILLAVFAFTSCKEEKEIEFKKVADIDLGNLSKATAKLKASAVFINLSDKEFDLKEMVLEFNVDGKNIGTIVTKMSKKIPPKGEFTIPIQYNYQTASFVIEGHDPSSQYSVSLTGDLVLKNSAGEKTTTSVKFAGPVEYLTKKEVRVEKRDERKQSREERKQERKEKREQNKQQVNK